MNSKNNEFALAEQLPYWEFFDEPIGHVVLTDGSLVSGLNLALKDIECLDDSEINQFTIQLRSALNSISEQTSVQFHLSVNSDFSETISKHINRKQNDCHELIKDIAEHRERQLLEDLQLGELYRPKLSVFVRTKMVNIKKSGFLSKPEVFTDHAVEGYAETLDLLNQNLESLKSFFESCSLKTQKLKRQDLIAHIYSFLNPKRSSSEPSPKVSQVSDRELPKEVLTDSPWLSPQSPREQLVFGDLILNFEQFTLDGFFHRTISLKTLPEVTYAGQLSSFLRMPFHYDLFLSFEVPSQADEMAKLQQKRKMAHSLASTQAGKATDLESETKLSSTEELIRELLNSGQRIFAAQMTIVLKAPADANGNKELNRQCREVLGRFRSLNGAEGLEETVGSWKITKGNLPGAPV
ncbi:MAG TPA: TraC family protein, partial [Pseudobdellovibrionaceae bacterium]|nr:TraC family protein [Pseudobdellovibrionaceae bacterium]